MKNITILDVATARGAKEIDGNITAGEFDRLGLPFFCGCQGCGASLAPYNAFPSTTGFTQCRDCIDDIGFPDVAAFEAFGGG